MNDRGGECLFRRHRLYINIKVSDLSQTEIVTSKVKKNITCFQSLSFDINKNNIMAETVCCIMLFSMVFSHLGPRASFNSFP